MMPYERVRAWQAAHQLALGVYQLTEAWPREERYGLTSQLRRAALSAPANIAEGTAKRGSREYRRFLDIAVGSLAEVAYLLRFSRDYGLLDQESWGAIEALRTRAAQSTWRLYTSVSSSAAGDHA